MAKIDLKDALLLYIDEGAEILRWARYGPEGHLGDCGQGATGWSRTMPPRRVIAIAAAGTVLLTRVDAPKRNRSKYLSALPNVIEETVCREAENIHVAPGPWPQAGLLPVAVVDKGSDEGLRDGTQPAVDAYMRLGMQSQAGGNPGGSLTRQSCVLT